MNSQWIPNDHQVTPNELQVTPNEVHDLPSNSQWTPYELPINSQWTFMDFCPVGNDLTTKNKIAEDMWTKQYTIKDFKN